MFGDLTATYNGLNDCARFRSAAHGIAVALLVLIPGHLVASFVGGWRGIFLWMAASILIIAIQFHYLYRSQRRFEEVKRMQQKSPPLSSGDH